MGMTTNISLAGIAAALAAKEGANPEPVLFPKTSLFAFEIPIAQMIEHRRDNPERYTASTVDLEAHYPGYFLDNNILSLGDINEYCAGLGVYVPPDDVRTAIASAVASYNNGNGQGTGTVILDEGYWDVTMVVDINESPAVTSYNYSADIRCLADNSPWPVHEGVQRLHVTASQATTWLLTVYATDFVGGTYEVENGYDDEGNMTYKSVGSDVGIGVTLTFTKL